MYDRRTSLSDYVIVLVRRSGLHLLSQIQPGRNHICLTTSGVLNGLRYKSSVYPSLRHDRMIIQVRYLYSEFVMFVGMPVWFGTV